MKLSRDKLKQIVKEELKNIKEYGIAHYGHGDDFDERSGNSREQQYQPGQYAPAKQGEPDAFKCGICHGTGKVETSIGLDDDYNPMPGESKTCETCQGQKFLKQISENKKLTRNKLQQIVREQLEEMMDEARRDPWYPRGGEDEGKGRDDLSHVELLDRWESLLAQKDKAKTEEEKKKIQDKMDVVSRKMRELEND